MRTVGDVRWGRRAVVVTLVFAVVLSTVSTVGLLGVAQGAECTTVSGGTVISSPGCYVLDGDVEEHEDGDFEEHEDGDFVEIAASDVVLDGNGHTVTGDGSDNGVHVDGDYTNVTIRNLRVTGWDRGIFVKDVTDATVRNVVGSSNKHTVEFDATASGLVDNVSATANSEYGIYLKDVTETTVRDSVVSNNGRDGLFVDGGDATVRDVTADANTDHGIYIKDTTDTVVRRVMATDNPLHGVYFEGSTDGTLADSTADDNGAAGFRVHHSDRTTVTNVTASGNAHGAFLSSTTTSLSDSTFTANAEGIRLKKHVHTVENITVDSSTQYGIYLDEADDNVVHGSRINASGTVGIYFPDDKPENNLFYDNYLNNSENVGIADTAPPTDWNVSRRTETNVVGGSLVGGNYWAAPDGNGPSQLFDNVDGDAFLDTPYTVDTAGQDALPLTDVTAAFEVSPAPYDFGDVVFGSTLTQSFTVESRVGSDVTVDSFDLSGDVASFSVSSDPTPVTLSTGGTTTVETTLSPTLTGGLSATLTTSASTDAYDTDTGLSASVTDGTVPAANTQGDTTVDEDTSVGFDGSGSTDNVGIASYAWDFGDGTTATGETPTHTYDTPGTYQANLTVTDLIGNTDSATRVVTVRDVTAPIADAGSNRTLHVNTAVSFDGTDSVDNVGIDSYAWDFGDSSGTNGATVSHTYTATGAYQVQLTTTDAAGNAGTDTVSIEVVDTTSPLARPGGDRTVDEDASVGFDGSASTDSDGTIVSYDWDFDTGDTATNVTPTYTFSDPGSYTVTLTVEDDAGNVASNETLVTVQDVTAPVADAGTDATVDEGASLAFDGSASTDNVGVASFEWDFGDENTTTASSPSHTYATPGTYTATLTVTDDAGNTAADTRVVTVQDVTAPVVDAGETRTVGVGETVSFDGSASADNVGVDSFDWDFDDGTTATGASPTHTYDTPGTYQATLTATDAAGNANSTTVTVYVSDTTAPTPDTDGDRTVTVGDTVTFDATGSTDDVGITDYRWTFDDGAEVGTASTTNTFESIGTSSVTLTVRDAAGNRASESILVTVENETTSGGSGGAGSGGSGGAGSGGSPAGVSAPTTAAPTTDAPADGSTDAIVQTAETTVADDEPVSVDFTADDAGTDASRSVSVTDIGFTPAVTEPVSFRVTTGQSLDGSPTFDRDDNTALLSNVRVDHSIANADVSDVSVGFRVSKARLAAIDVPAEDVALYRYEDGSWTELPTTLTAESEDAYAFRASSPGLSEFAIGAKQPEFALQTVRVAVDEIRVGDDIQVFVRITNDGGADGSFLANLVINDDVVESRELTIAAGGRRQIRFTQPVGEVGSYSVRVNDALAGEVIVVSDDSGDVTTVSATPAEQSDTEGDGGTDTGALGAVAVVALAAVVLVGYYRRQS